MKLIIQIPCFNEEHTLPATFADLPKQIDGIDEIETLIFGAAVVLIGFQIMVIGLLADLIGSNRRLVEDLLYRARRDAISRR